MRLDSYLCFAGVEISNVNRVFVYGHTLSPAALQVGGNAAIVTPTGGAGYTDTYSDTFDADPGFTVASGGLCSHCGVFDEGPYNDPATDDAPWYDSRRPESADFLGLWMRDARLLSVYGRDVGARASEGSTFGPLGMRHRIITVVGTMLARTKAGMAYGERWLSEALGGGYCRDGVEGDELEILQACPGSDSDTSGFRTLMRAGLLDGPDFAPIGGSESVWQEVSFQLGSELPWLFEAPVPLVDGALANTFAGGQAVVPAWPGDGTLRYTAKAVTDCQGVRFWVSNEELGSFHGMPPYDYVIPYLKADEEIVIDGARRQVYIIDPTTKRRQGALSRIFVNGLFEWPDLPPCSMHSAWVSVQSGTITSKVDLYKREV